MGGGNWKGQHEAHPSHSSMLVSFCQGYGDGMANMMSTCLDSSELAVRFMSSSVVYNDMQNAVGVCMGMRKSKKKTSKKGKEEEKKKSKKTSKKPSKKEEEKPSKTSK